MASRFCHLFLVILSPWVQVRELESALGGAARPDDDLAGKIGGRDGGPTAPWLHPGRIAPWVGLPRARVSSLIVLPFSALLTEAETQALAAHKKVLNESQGWGSLVVGCDACLPTQPAARHCDRNGETVSRAECETLLQA